MVMSLDKCIGCHGGQVGRKCGRQRREFRARSSSLPVREVQRPMPGRKWVVSLP
jgi:hypothetical protein